MIKMLYCKRKALKQVRFFANVTSCHGHPMTKFFKKSYTFKTKRTKDLHCVLQKQKIRSQIDSYVTFPIFRYSSAAQPADCEVTEM